MIAGSSVVVPLAAILVLAWALRSGRPLSTLGFTPPKSWTVTILAGLGFGILFKVLMKAIVMPLLGAPDINQAYGYLTGNAAALPAILFTVIVVAGFGEEVVFRGFLFERFGKLLGSSMGATISIVLLTSTLFGLAHYADQGVPGAQQAVIVGLVFGTIFAITRRIWMVMIAHAAFDVTAVFIIYWNLEAHVAHLVFKS